MSKFAKRAALLLLPVLLTGCAKGTAGIALLTNCNVGNHVSVSKKDVLTEETAKEINQNNASREAAGCEARPNG